MDFAQVLTNQPPQGPALTARHPVAGVRQALPAQHKPETGEPGAFLSVFKSSLRESSPPRPAEAEAVRAKAPDDQAVPAKTARQPATSPTATEADSATASTPNTISEATPAGEPAQEQPVAASCQNDPARPQNTNQPSDPVLATTGNTQPQAEKPSAPDGLGLPAQAELSEWLFCQQLAEMPVQSAPPETKPASRQASDGSSITAGLSLTSAWGGPSIPAQSQPVAMAELVLTAPQLAGQTPSVPAASPAPELKTSTTPPPAPLWQPAEQTLQARLATTEPPISTDPRLPQPNLVSDISPPQPVSAARQNEQAVLAGPGPLSGESLVAKESSSEEFIQLKDTARLTLQPGQNTSTQNTGTLFPHKTMHQGGSLNLAGFQVLGNPTGALPENPGLTPIQDTGLNNSLPVAGLPPPPSADSQTELVSPPGHEKTDTLTGLPWQQPEATAASSHSEKPETHFQISRHGATSSELTERFQLMRQLTDKIQLLHSSRQQAIQLSLHPAELGRMSLRLQQEAQQLHLHILTEFPLAKELIESQLHTLRQQLQSQGLHLQQVSIDVQPDWNQAQHPDQESRQQSPQGQRSAQPVFSLGVEGDLTDANLLPLSQLPASTLTDGLTVNTLV